jgi:hypothetical protein
VLNEQPASPPGPLAFVKPSPKPNEAIRPACKFSIF